MAGTAWVAAGIESAAAGIRQAAAAHGGLGAARDWQGGGRFEHSTSGQRRLPPQAGHGHHGRVLRGHEGVGGAWRLPGRTATGAQVAAPAATIASKAAAVATATTLGWALSPEADALTAVTTVGTAVTKQPQSRGYGAAVAAVAVPVVAAGTADAAAVAVATSPWLHRSPRSAVRGRRTVVAARRPRPLSHNIADDPWLPRPRLLVALVSFS